MLTRLRHIILPETQRRTLEEVSQDLEFGDGESGQRSAFWSLLFLSAVIAAAGVVADSTATVIGAMIIAPLSKPIMGVALAGVKRKSNGSVRYVLGGVALVVTLGVITSYAMPASDQIIDNSQVAGRVSPSLIDLVAAMGAGLAGALAYARRDVASVLPGVAISLSLVPPLVVVGICLGEGAFALSFGALVLFVSNVVALVMSGLFIFTVLGYSAVAARATPVGPDRTRHTMAVLFAIVAVLLGSNSAINLWVSREGARVEQAAREWVSKTPGAELNQVELRGTTFEVHVITPTDLPSARSFTTELANNLPEVFDLRVVSTRGQAIDIDRG